MVDCVELVIFLDSSSCKQFNPSKYIAYSKIHIERLCPLIVRLQILTIQIEPLYVINVVLVTVPDQDVSLSMKCVDYIGGVDSDSHINIYTIATVKETGQRYVFQEPLWIEKPHIEIKV